ncbi:MAG: serine/threonine-protein kinase [Actinomycetota bacterium]
MTTEGTATKEVAGRYRLLAPLGKGGMGVVWRAEDALLKRQVAMKAVEVPAAVTSEDTEVVRGRVMREARAAARLTHPAAVTVYDVIQEGGQIYIVMELVEAPSLDELVEGEGPLSPERAAAIGLEVLDALEAAHATGIVHRDVKPGNVMVPSDGHVKLADFGIASVKGDPRITSSGLIMGSPAFMSPEQARGEEAGPGTDLWALGATLYFAVEGRPPFDKGQAIPTLNATLHDEPPPPRRAGALGPVITSMLAKSLSDRPDARSLRPRLQEVAEAGGPAPVPSEAPDATRSMTEDGVPATAVALDATSAEAEPAARTDAPARSAAPARAASPPRPGASRAWMTAAAVGVVAVLGFLLWRAVAGDDPSPRARDDNRGGTVTQPRDRPSEEPTEDATAASEEPPADDGSLTPYGELPEGFDVSYPSGWTVVPGLSGPTSADFRDPAGGRYLRVAWTDEPGDDPVAKVRDEIAPSFATRYPTYEEIAIEPTTFEGYDAVHWEYTYSTEGAELRAINLQFVTGDYGFALNWQTRAAQWDDSLALFEQLKKSFRSP